MNPTSDSNPGLEPRLRAHYGAKADELRLPAMESSDVLERNGSSVALVVAKAPVRAGRRRSTWMVAAALVAGATIGAGAIMLTRDDTPTSGQSVVPQLGPTGDRTVEGAPFMTCPEDGVPAAVVDMNVVNDIRLPNVPLPVAPGEWCVVDHWVNTYFGLSGAEFDVYSSCSPCDAPTASVAVVHPFENGEAVYENSDGDADPADVDVSGHSARYYAPDDSAPIARLYVDVGADAPFMLAGWGLNGQEMATVAEALLAGDVVPEEREVPGLEFVYSGALGDYWPGNIPMTTTIGVGYGTGGGAQIARYSVLQYPDQPPLEAYAWSRPNPSFTTTDGRRAVIFPASVSFAGTEQTTVIREVDDNTTVVWSANGTPPMSADELAAIELTPAPADDPRWLEIAYESGNYDALG